MDLKITLNRAMYDELVDAAARAAKRDEEPPSPVDYAKELIESCLAERRLERIAFVSRRAAIPLKRVVDPIVRVSL